MLSLSAIKSVGQAASYYMDQDNYYLQGEGQAFSEWYGKGAKLLNLSGAVDAEMFKALLEGKMPDGTQVGAMLDGSIKHRPGTDVTFSSPKTVSILGYLGKDGRLIEAHKDAVRLAMSQLERLTASARITESGVTSIENTRNLIVGLFHHDTSRLYDPQMHTHAVVMNETLRSDGAWRALASSMGIDGEQVGGFGERLRAFQIYFSSIYRSELAKSVTDMGYQIRHAGPHGMWEIDKVPDAVLKHFSQRSEQMKAAGGGDQSSAAYKDMLAILTREPKKAIDRGELNEYWQERLQSLGFDAKAFVDEAKENAHDNPSSHSQSQISDRARLHVDMAMGMLSDFQTSFSFDQVFNRAVSLGMGEVANNDIKAAIDEKLKSGELLGVNRNGTRLTTQALLDTEQGIVDQAAKLKDTKAAHHPNVARESSSVAQKIGTDRLSIVSLQSSRQFEVLSDALKDFERQGYTVRMLAPNKFGANDLASNITREKGGLFQWFRNVGKPQIGESVKGYLFTEARKLDSPFAGLIKSKDLVVVDQAHKLSHGDLNNLLTLSEKRGTRLVFVDNSKGAKGAQASIDLLSRAGVSKHTVQTGDFNKQLAINIQLQSAPLAVSNKNTLVLTDTKSNIERLTNEVRNELKVRGMLDREEIKVNSLTPKYVDKTRMSSSSFEKGNMVRLYHRDRPFEDFTVLSAVKNEGKLRVATQSGKVSTLRMSTLKASQFRVFETKEISLAQGDKVRATATMQKLGLAASKRYEVSKIDAGRITLNDGNKSIVISKRDAVNLPLEHDYVRTLNQAAGRFNEVIVDTKAWRLSSGLINELSGVASKISIYTDNLNQAEKSLVRTTNKMSATDLVLTRSPDGMKAGTSDVDALKTKVKESVGHLVNAQNRSELERAIDHGIHVLSEREAAFGSHELFAEVAKQTAGMAGFAEIQHALVERLQSGELIKNNHGLVTTAEALKTEQSLLTTLNAGKGAVAQAMDITTAKSVLSEKGLTPSQGNAAQMFLSSKDQFIAIQGFAGTGKSTLVKTIQEITGKTILGLAPTHKATFELREKGLEAQTLQSFVQDAKAGNLDLGDKIIVLDEASQASNKDVLAFADILKASGNRAIIQGDSIQYQGIGSGKPWDLLLAKANIDKAYCTDIVRQQNIDLKRAAEFITQGNIDGAIDKIAMAQNTPEVRSSKQLLSARAGVSVLDLANIIELSKPGENAAVDALKNTHINDKPRLDDIKALERQVVLSAATQDYLALTKEQRSNTIFVILGHEDRASAHQMIRDGLRERGELSGSDISVTRLVNSNLSSEELKDTNNLKAGQVMMLGKTANTIKSVDQKSGAIHLTGTDGKEHIKFADKLGDHASLYDKQAASLAKGDVIRATTTDKEKGIFAGTTYKVTALNQGRVVLADLNSGQTRKLDPKKLKDGLWDYAYTTTGYSAQSATEDNKLSVYFSWQKNLTTLRAMGVTETRPVNHSTTYTDDIGKLKERLKESISEDHKNAALEVTEGKIRPSLTPSKTFSQPSNQAHKNGVTKAIERQANQKQHIDAKAVARALAKDVRGVVTRLQGEPNAKLSNATQLRYGKKGSLVINLSGTKQGTWHNFETGESGDLLSLIQTELQLPFKEALQYGSDLVGGVGNITLPPTRSMPTASKSSDAPSKTQKWADTLLEGVKPIQGTLAETYLTKVRGISKISGKDLKFHPRVYVEKDDNGKSINAPAMVAISRDGDGQPQGLQVTYLGKDGNKLDTDIQKRSLGKLSGNHVTLSGKKGGGMSFVAEGVETGLSVREAIKDAHVIATLGKHNIKNIDPKTLSDTVVLIADNDGKQLKEDKEIMDAAARLSDSGKEVHVVMPESLGGKTDMNDILKQKGTQGVLNTLANRTIAIDQKTVGMPKHNNLAGFKRNDDNDMKSTAKAYEQNKMALMQERSAQIDNVRSQTAQKDEVSSPVPDRVIDRQLQMEREL